MFVLILSSLALLWIYFLYPVAVRSISRIFPCHIAASSHYQPTLAIIIPTVNEQAHIQEKLTSLLKLNYPGPQPEIIVVDDGSSDRTCEMTRQFEPQGVKLLSRSARIGKTEAILFGALSTSAEIIVITDASCLFDSNTVKSTTACFADRSVGAVTCSLEPASIGMSIVACGNRIYWNLDSRIKAYESSLHSVAGAVGEFLAIRRPLLASFDLRDSTGADDSDLSYHVLKHGLRVIMAPAASVREDPPILLSHFFEKKVRIATQNIRAMLANLLPILNTSPRYGLFIFSSRRLLALISPLLILANILSALAVADSQPYIAMMIGIFWGTSVLLACAGLLPRLARSAIPQLALVAWLMNAAIFIAWVHYLMGKKYLVWERLPR